MLILPAEPAYARLSWSFQKRNLNGLAVNPSGTDLSLMIRYRKQGAVIDGLNKAVAQSIESRPQRADMLCGGDMFLRLWNHSPVVDDGPAGDRGQRAAEGFEAAALGGAHGTGDAARGARGARSGGADAAVYQYEVAGGAVVSRDCVGEA